MMLERTQETIDRVLAADAAQRAGQRPTLAAWEVLTTGTFPTRTFTVVFLYEDGRRREWAPPR